MESQNSKVVEAGEKHNDSRLYEVGWQSSSKVITTCSEHLFLHVSSCLPLSVKTANMPVELVELYF